MSKDKYTEPETGLHNLLPNAKKAMELRKLVLQYLHENTKRDYSGDMEAALKEVTDAYIEGCNKYYGSELSIHFKGVVMKDDPTSEIEEGQIIILPMNLASFILNVGYDIPPTRLPEEGSWEGEAHVYTFTKAVDAMTIPVMVLEDKLIT